MDKTLQIQTQIRHNAEEISTALSEMGKWEKQMKNRDGNIKAAHLKAARVPRAPIRSGVGTVPVQDKGGVSSAKSTEPKKQLSSEPASSLWQTPSSIVASTAPLRSVPAESIAVPSARGTYEAKDLEESERERGNAEFKGGNFTAAVKCYTKCLGLKGRNYVAFSNRAMAYLKLKEYARAVSDCSCALLIEPAHVKSLLRRSTAYNAVGKHRAALRDLLAAAAIEPANKQVRQDMLTTKELLRNAVSRAPLAILHLQHANLVGTNSTTGDNCNTCDVGVQGPDVRPPNFTTVVIEEEDEEVVEETVAPIMAPEVVHSRAATLPPTTTVTTATAITTSSAATSTTRVSITIDDDSDTEDTPVTTSMTTKNTATSDSTKDTIDTSVTTPTKATSIITSTTSSTKKAKKAVSATPPPVSTAAITSCYELERELEVASKDPTLIARVFERIKRTEIKGILSNLLEPMVLYRLLNAVFLHFGTRKALICVKWYTTVAGTKKFSIQYGLLDEAYKVTLRENLQTVMDYVKETEVEGLSVEKVAEVQALY